MPPLGLPAEVDLASSKPHLSCKPAIPTMMSSDSTTLADAAATVPSNSRANAAPSSQLPEARERLLALPRELARFEETSAAIDALIAGDSVTFGNVWGGARALLGAMLANETQRPLLVVCPRPADIDLFCDTASLFTQRNVAPFPAWESEAGETSEQDPISAQRLRLLKRLAHDEMPDIVVTSIQSLLQPCVERGDIAGRTRYLSNGDQLDVEVFTQWLSEGGLTGVPAVALPGEYASRGGIIDVFPLDAEYPLRIELFDDEIESLRRFDVETQRSVEVLQTATITALGQSQRIHKGLLTQYLPEQTCVMLCEPIEIDEEGRQFLQRLDEREQVHELEAVMRSVAKFPLATAAGIATGSFQEVCQLPVESVERFAGSLDQIRQEVERLAHDEAVVFVSETHGEAERISDLFSTTQAAEQGRLSQTVGSLHGGFRLSSLGVALVGTNELFGRQETTRTVRRFQGRAIDSFLELRKGELVVHVGHGIARYRGLSMLEKDGRTDEHLELEFRGGTRLFVPASKIDLVQKYVGGSNARPTLAKLGGKTWVRQKQAATTAATDLAAELIELQAARQSRPGIAFPEDSDWQREFDASFPYTETPDQLAAISAIKEDMLHPRPMDRLLCGDVGFGKTEVAMRAAFKAVDAGYQVAVLVPTTILAEQHFRTFRDRMAGFPFEIAVLSRFCTKRQQSQTLKKLSEGHVDIVVGTHRLAQADVQFANLGLVVIDEEQRFGVAVKERLKAIRKTVDVLTMTATPIPRTLHFSLLGLRDISNLETAPEDRLAVETRLARFDEDLIRHAVMRELNRGGQVFFVHNRVNDILAVAGRLQRILPEASIAIGHGQMPEDELAEVMLHFIEGRSDILLATTIIESGLDIPRANTIFIDEADRFGLSDLHQLRGRVGRYRHRAYCYLLVDENRQMTPEASRRLRAIEEFSQIGAGFALSMRDLEIRGAGNIIGTQQSGHISTVGYELYCSLLEAAARQLQHLPPRESIDVTIDVPGAAYLPTTYVSDMRLKIDLYRRIGRLNSLEEIGDLREELTDRFGEPPAVVLRLLELARLRITAQRFGIHSIDTEDKFVVFHHASPTLMAQLSQSAEVPVRLVDRTTAYVPLGRERISSGECLSDVQSLLLAGEKLL